MGHQVKRFCNKKKFEIIETAVNYHRANALMERLLETIEKRPACITEEKGATNSFNIKHALKDIIIQKLRICKQKTTTT